MRAATVAMQPEILGMPLLSKMKIGPAPRRRNICVFDPREDAHFRTLKSILGGLVDIYWFDQFSKESLDGGDLSEGLSWDLVSRLSPAMLIVELELLAYPNWRTGVQLMENFRRSQKFNTGVALTIISNAQAILAAEPNFERLGVDWIFCWGSFYGPNSFAIKQSLLRKVRGLL